VEDETFVADLAGAKGGEPGDQEVDRLRTESIAIVRDLILKGNADLVPELVRGESLADLMESIEPARAAFQRIAETVRAVAPVVPAGGTGSGTRIAIDDLSADSLIKRGLAAVRN
jgi:hypothetical protein